MTLKHFSEISENEYCLVFGIFIESCLWISTHPLRRIKSSVCKSLFNQLILIQGYDQVREVEKYLQKLSVVRQMDIIAASKSLILKLI